MKQYPDAVSSVTLLSNQGQTGTIDQPQQSLYGAVTMLPVALNGFTATRSNSSFLLFAKSIFFSQTTSAINEIFRLLHLKLKH